MSTDDEHTFGLAAGRRTQEKSVPKQRTAAEDWSKLNDEDRASVKRLRALDPRGLTEPSVLASPTALTYVRRHG